MPHDVIDDNEFSLEVEERMVRGAIHAAHAARKTNQLGGLLTAQSTLRNSSLRLESHNVLDKRRLYQGLDDLVRYIARLCKSRKFPYAAKDTATSIRAAITNAHNRPGEQLRDKSS